MCCKAKIKAPLIYEVQHKSTHRLINSRKPNESRTYQLTNWIIHKPTNSPIHQLTNSQTNKPINSQTHQPINSPTLNYYLLFYKRALIFDSF